MSSMTEQDREQLGIELRRQMKDLASKLDALGIGGTRESGRKLAPDGGPQSNAHLFLRAQMNEVLEVRYKRPGKPFAIIRKKDFDPELHEKVEPNPDEPRRRSIT